MLPACGRINQQNSPGKELYDCTMQEMKGGNPWSQALDTAPCVIVVTADQDSAFYDELLEMDAGIAAGAMLIQAADLGLTTCILSIAPQEERIRSVDRIVDLFLEDFERYCSGKPLLRQVDRLIGY